MPQQTIPYASLNIPSLLSIHNDLAPLRGVPKLKTWHDSYCNLVQRVAILRTQKVLPPAPKKKAKKRVAQPKKRKQPIRDAILEAITFISHYEDAKTGARISKIAAKKRPPDSVVSVGLPYSECVKRVRRRFPNYKTHSRYRPAYGAIALPGTFRVIACRVREGLEGYRHCTLPHKRPHGTKGKCK